MTTSPLLRNDNPYLRTTDWQSKPSRQDPAWRYRPEHEFLIAVDQWDAAENHRRQVDAQVREHDKRMLQRELADARAAKEREDKVINTEMERRYLSAGGDSATFDKDLPELRREHAKRVALGLDQPLNSTTVLREQLRALRRNIWAASGAGPVASEP